MKKLLLVVCVFFTQTTFAQNVSVEDWNNDGVLEYVKWSDDGKKLEEGFLVDGKYHGKWISYTPDGDIRAIARFKNGKKDGVWQFFNEEGLMTHEIVYEDNRRVQASITRHFE